MPSTKMIDYHRWRKEIENKHFSDVTEHLDYGLKHRILNAEKCFGDNPTITQLLGKRGEISGMIKHHDEKALKKLVADLKKTYEKERVFRQDKVDEIKRLIKNHHYHVSGKMVVDKWFPDDPAM